MEGRASSSPLSALLDHEVDLVPCLLPPPSKKLKLPTHNPFSPPRERDSWSDSSIHCLLDHFTKKFLSLNRGNLRTTDWAELAQLVSDGTLSKKSSEQCKNKIDNLKKQYKKERARREAHGSSGKPWAYYNRIDEIFGAASQIMVGIPGGMDACHCSLPDCGDEYRIADACEVGSPTPPVDSPKLDAKGNGRPDLDDACHSPLPKLAKSSGMSGYLEKASFESSIGRDLKEGLLGFAEVIQKIETAKMEMQMDIERLRAGMELQRTQMMLNVQLQIAECLSRSRRKRSHTFESSSSE